MFMASTYLTGLECCSRAIREIFFYENVKCYLTKIKYIYLEETGSKNNFDCGGHLWPGHQILRDKPSLNGENVARSCSGSSTASFHC